MTEIQMNIGPRCEYASNEYKISSNYIESRDYQNVSNTVTEYPVYAENTRAVLHVVYAVIISQVAEFFLSHATWSYITL